MTATGHWKVQRLTAVLLIPLTLWLLFSVAKLSSASYPVVQAWITPPLTAIFLTLFVMIAGHHAFLGLQVILEDYTHGALRKRAILFSRMVLATATLLSLYAIFSITTQDL